MTAQLQKAILVISRSAGQACVFITDTGSIKTLLATEGCMPWLDRGTTSLLQSSLSRVCHNAGSTTAASRLTTSCCRRWQKAGLVSTPLCRCWASGSSGSSTSTAFTSPLTAPFLLLLLPLKACLQEDSSNAQVSCNEGQLHQPAGTVCLLALLCIPCYIPEVSVFLGCCMQQDVQTFGHQSALQW